MAGSEARTAGSRWKRAAWYASVPLVGLTASFLMWNPLEVYERAHVSRTTRQSMESLRADLRSDMEARLLAQIRLAQLWDASFSEKDRELSSTLFLDHHTGYVAMEWADESGRVVCAIDRGGRNEAGSSAYGTDEVLRTAHLPPSVDKGYAVLAPRFRLSDGRSALRVIAPVVRHDAIVGFLVAIVDIRAAFDAMVDDHKDLGYGVSVREGSTEIYRMPGSETDYEATLAEHGSLQLPGTTWTVRVWPKREILSRWRSSLPEIAMALGGLLGSVLMIAVHFARAARRGSRDLQRAHDGLELRVRARTLELQQVNQTLQGEVVDRKRAEDSYRDLSGRLLRLQDVERRRIARDLHDSTAQMLGALAINVDRSRTLARVGDLTRLAGVLEESGAFVEEVTQEIRTVSYLLHPPMLDDLGLEYVLPWYANGFSRRSGIAARLDVQANLGRLTPEIETTLFRIVQEALANVHRHSGSPTVEIHVARDEESATLEIRDRGRGLPQAVLDAVSRPAGSPIGVGIAGMRERVRQLGGRMEISSNGKGTSVRTVLPLTEHARVEPATCCDGTCGCPACAAGAFVARRTGTALAGDRESTAGGSAAA